MTPRQHAIDVLHLWLICGGGATAFYAAAQIWIDAKTKRRQR